LRIFTARIVRIFARGVAPEVTRDPCALFFANPSWSIAAFCCAIFLRDIAYALLVVVLWHISAVALVVILRHIPVTLFVAVSGLIFTVPGRVITGFVGAI
jgi:hypothetical protein